MATFTHTRTISYTANGAIVVNAALSQTGDEETDLDTSIAAGATNQQFAYNLVAANLKSVFIYSDNGLVIKTNSSSTPQDTITLAPGQALAWQSGDPGAAPFAGNVTALFVSNSGSAASALKMRALSNQ